MAAPAVPPRFSFDAASGRLTENTATGVNTLFAWPVIHAFRWAAANGRSVALQPEIAILPEQRCRDAFLFERLPGLDDHAQRALEGYCATIPPRVRRVIAQLPERQWEVLAWAARGGLLAEELLVSNPALAFAVANIADVSLITPSGRSAETLQLILPRRKQREILERLSFAPTERVRRIVRKVMPGSVSVAALVLLRDQLQKPAVGERLAHVPAIGPHVLTMIGNDTIAHVTLASLEALARADEASADRLAATLVANAARVWAAEMAGKPAMPHPVPHGQPVRCPEPAHLAVQRTDFPPVPFPGNDAIVPILYRSGLLNEGHEQNNCVFDCAPDVARGKIAIYRVLAPERCTLSVKLRRGRWVVDQLKGWSNQEPGPEVVLAVREWLATSYRDAKIPR